MEEKGEERGRKRWKTDEGKHERWRKGRREEGKDERYRKRRREQRKEKGKTEFTQQRISNIFHVFTVPMTKYQQVIEDVLIGKRGHNRITRPS